MAGINFNMNLCMNPGMQMGGTNSKFQQGFMMGMQMAQMMEMMQMMMGGMNGGGCGMNPMMMNAMASMMMGGMDPMMMGMNPMMMGDGMSDYMGMQGCGCGRQQQYSPVPWGGGSPYGGYDGGYGGGYDGGYGGGGGGGRSHGVHRGNSSVPVNSVATGGNGSDAVALGERFLGMNSIDVRGKLPNFTAAGGQTNNCADFVSSCLESTGQLNGHFVGVKNLEQNLLKQGYHRIPAEQAKPGDVWMNESRGHTELVAAPGGKRLLGSNNDRPGHQVISEKPHNGGGVYYSRG